MRGGGRSFWVPITAMVLGTLAVLVAIYELSRRDKFWTGPKGSGQTAAPTEEDDLSVEEVTRVLERHRDRLMQLPGVIGLYVGADAQSQLVLRILVLPNHPETVTRLPKTLDGVRVEVHESDAIKPL